MTNGEKVFSVSKSEVSIAPAKARNTQKKLVGEPAYIESEKSLLEHPQPNLRRCSRCILPETMPFINFDNSGVCNYCLNYKSKISAKHIDELVALLEPARSNGQKILVPFSGGRDSSFTLHFITKELGFEAVAYTYDWGMITDLGRRNVSRMTSALGVEDLLFAADIDKKRKNVKMNLKAWLSNPDVSMLSLLTAGDKHFFKYVNEAKRKTNTSVNIWGINPLETTHFKTGVLGLGPDFGETKVYSSKNAAQLRFQKARFRRMLKSPGYFNSSLFDTLSGEYYRTYSKKTDYFHFFDYLEWNEKTIDELLIGEYDWEKAEDTPTTWRIGDATAAFYNYVYMLVLGFTENDTLRSNQIREGQITRSEALQKIEDENSPRYFGLKWYLEALDMDFRSVIQIINRMSRFY